jgi:hypothetical protein
VNPFGHIDLRVRDLEAATLFYDALLPSLGFSERYHGGEWKVWATTDPSPEAAYFAVTEDCGARGERDQDRVAGDIGSRGRSGRRDCERGGRDAERAEGDALRAGVLRRLFRRSIREPARGIRPTRLRGRLRAP